jgi:hypothetical protein
VNSKVFGTKLSGYFIDSHPTKSFYFYFYLSKTVFVSTNTIQSRNIRPVFWKTHFREAYWRGGLCTVDLLVLTSSEAICLVRCLGCSQLVSSLSPLVNKLFAGIIGWAQTLIRLFTDRQLSHKVGAYLIHNSCPTSSQGIENTKKKFMSISFTTHV